MKSFYIILILFAFGIYAIESDSHAENSHCAGNAKLLTIVECVLNHSPEIRTIHPHPNYTPDSKFTT
jgi:hypothetical protein